MTRTDSKIYYFFLIKSSIFLNTFLMSDLYGFQQLNFIENSIVSFLDLSTPYCLLGLIYKAYYLNF